MASRSATNRIEGRRGLEIRALEGACRAQGDVHATAMERRVRDGHCVGDGGLHLRRAPRLRAGRRGVGHEHVNDGRRCAVRISGTHEALRGYWRQARWQLRCGRQGCELAHHHGAVTDRGEVIGDAARHHAAHQRAAVPRKRGGAPDVARNHADPRRMSAPVAFEPRAIEREEHVVEQVQQEGRARCCGRRKRGGRGDRCAAPSGAHARCRAEEPRACPARGPALRTRMAGRGPRRLEPARGQPGQGGARARRWRVAYGTATNTSFEGPLTPHAFCASTRT